MFELQLELNLNNLSASELKFVEMEKQITLMSESMHKVRKKLFAEVGILKKTIQSLHNEKEALASRLVCAEEKLGLRSEVKFDYEKKDCLFSIESLQETENRRYAGMR